MFLFSIAFASAVIIVCLVAGPRTYEDCVLKYVSTASNKASAIIVRNSCESKFPASKEFDPGTARLDKKASGMFDDLIPPK